MAKGENGAWDLNALYDVERSEKNCGVKVIEGRGWEKVGESSSCGIGCKHQQTTRGEVRREGWRHVEMISKLRCSGTVERAPFAGRRWRRRLCPGACEALREVNPALQMIHVCGVPVLP